MKSEWRFCVVCNRNVQVMRAETPAEEDYVCLDIGSICTGGMCPMGAVAPGSAVEPVRPETLSHQL